MKTVYSDMRIKIFSGTAEEVEKDVNEFLKKVTMQDIKLQEEGEFYKIMVIYYGNE